MAEGKYWPIVILLDYQGLRGPQEELCHWTKPTLPPGFAPMILNKPELLQNAFTFCILNSMHCYWRALLKLRSI